jgi:hypothetical protein
MIQMYFGRVYRGPGGGGYSVGENGWRMFSAFFAILLWIGLVMLVVVAIVEGSTGVTVDAAAGDYARRVSRAEISEIARKAAQDVASNSGPTWKVWGEGHNPG